MANISSIKLPSGVTYNLKDTVSGYSTTDEKVKSEVITTGATYYLASSSSALTSTGTLIKHSSLRGYISSDSITNGYVTFILGNQTSEGTAGAKYGLLRLYGRNNYYIDLISDNPSANRTVTLPNNSGTLALTSDIPSVPAWALASTKPSYTASEISLTDESTTESQMAGNVQAELAFLHNVVDSGTFLTEETDPIFTASAAAGITSADISNWNSKVSDDKTWNGVTLDTSVVTMSNNSCRIPFMWDVNGETSARIVKASKIPVASTIAMYDANAYLKSTTPSANDNSTKVATTAYVDAAVPTTASDIGAIPTTAKGAANGVAPLDTNGLIVSAYLPSYVDDVLEYATRAGFPAMGETGKIYVDTDTNKTYRWGGSEYVEISASLALGKTSSTAAPGDHTHSVSITPSTTSVYSITSLGTANTPTQIDTSKFSGGSLTMTINGTDSSQLDITFTAAAPQSGFYTAGTAATMPTRSQVTGLWNGYTSATAQAIQ